MRVRVASSHFSITGEVMSTRYNSSAPIVPVVDLLPKM